MMKCPSNWSTSTPICAAFRESVVLCQARKNTESLPRQLVNGPDITVAQGFERHHWPLLYLRKLSSVSSRSVLSP
jgi:hypothetical protein